MLQTSARGKPHRHGRRAHRGRDGEGKAFIDETTAGQAASPPDLLNHLLQRRNSTPKAKVEVVAQGIAASPERGVQAAWCCCPPRPSSLIPRSTRTIRSCWYAKKPAPEDVAGMRTLPRASSPAPAVQGRVTPPSSLAAGASRASSALRGGQDRRSRADGHDRRQEGEGRPIL